MNSADPRCLVPLLAAGLALSAFAAPPAAAAAVSPVPAVSTVPAGVPLTLDQAYADALARSEAVAEKGETYAQLIAQIDEMWSAVQPRLSVNASHQWQDTPGAGVSFPLPANQQTVAIAGHQPLFSGLREFLAVRETRAQGRSAELAFERAKQLLYQDVAAAYLNLLQSHQDLGVREAQLKLDADRIKELEGFERIGRSRVSEVLAARSQRAQDEADLETAWAQERVDQETMRFLTGRGDRFEPAELPLPAEADAASYLARARSRPDVESAREDLKASSLFVSIQRRQYWPTISLDGNYYLLRPDNYYRHVNWDATLTGSIPLYSGGQISAQVREAKARERYNEQALSLAERQAALDVRTAHSDLTSDLRIVRALMAAKDLAEANAKAQDHDYRYGLVTNLDVLSSLATVESTSLRLDQARAAAILAGIRLEVAAGGPESAR
ncbi:MAG: TolC family protein [Elusimicrobia bacterium]|nr:TolC family protein [Elusimicrobiota bacterium]